MKKFIFALFIFLGLTLSAAAQWQESPHAEPNLHNAWYFLKKFPDLSEHARDAIHFRAEGNEDASKQSMQAAIRENMRHEGVRLTVALWSLEMGNIRQASQQAQAALTLQPDSTDAMYLRGIVAMHEKDYVTAETNFFKLHVLIPDNVAAIHYLALALCEQNDPVKLKRAERYARLNTRMKDAPPEAFAAAGWVQFKKGDLAAAEKFLLEAVRLSDGKVTNPDIKYYIAAVMANSADPELRNHTKEILDEILESKTPFYMRADAERLRKTL